TTRGLVRINPGGTYEIFTTKQGLPSDYVTNIYQDREKNMWFGTSAGLSKIVTHSAIRAYKTENGLLSNAVHLAIPLGQGKIMTSGDKGIQLFNKQTGIFEPLSLNANRFFLRNRLGVTDTFYLAGDYRGVIDFGGVGLQYCIRDSLGNLFFAQHGGVYHLMPGQEKPTLLMSEHLTGMLQTEAGNIWVATWNDGLYYFSYSSDGNNLRVLS